MQTANGNAIGGGAIVACLIDMLVTKNVLTAEDVGTLLDNSRHRLTPFGQSPDIAAAMEMLTNIATMYATKRHS